MRESRLYPVGDVQIDLLVELESDSVGECLNAGAGVPITLISARAPSYC